MVTLAPASSNFFLMFSASSFETASLIVDGAASTRSFASFRPRDVTSRTALMTLIFLSPTSLRRTANSVCASTGAAAAAGPAAAAGGAAAAAAPGCGGGGAAAAPPPPKGFSGGGAGGERPTPQPL